MTPDQCQAARRLLGWSARELARKASLTGPTVKRFESGGETQKSSIRLLRIALEQAGIRIEPGAEPAHDVPRFDEVVLMAQLPDGSRVVLEPRQSSS